MTSKQDKAENKSLARLSTEGVVDDYIKMLDQAEMIADKVVKSDTFGRAFKSSDGKEVNKSDVIAAILLGSELGIPPMAAITLGRRLNADSYMKVMKGKALGLDPISALQSVNIIETSNGDTIHTGVGVITKVLLDTKVKFIILEDFEPIYEYKHIKSNQKVNYEQYKDNIFVVDKFTPEEEFRKAEQESKICVFKTEVTKRTKIRFERSGFEPIEISYTLQQATDAGLFMGINSISNEKVKGKANWNNHPATMLRNRTLTIGGRIICGDRLMNTYSNDEASEFTDYTLEQEDVEDVKNYMEEGQKKQSEDNNVTYHEEGDEDQS